MLEKKLLTRFDFSLSSTTSDPSSLFNGPIDFLNLGLFAFESRFQYSAVVLTSANRSLKCLALALHISAVISFLSFLYAAYLLGCFVRFASLNNLSLRFILGLIVLLIHGADVLLTFTSLNTNVFISHKDPNYLSVMLHSEMDKLSIWFEANKFSLNLKKTKFMVFKPRQKRSTCNIQISILDNQNIVKVKETNFPGLTLDENLHWKSRISNVANKCSFFLPKTSLRMLYCSLVYPYYYYYK